MRKAFIPAGEDYKKGVRPATLGVQYMEVYYLSPRYWVMCDNAGVVCSSDTRDQIRWPDPQWAQKVLDRVQQAVQAREGVAVVWNDYIPTPVKDEVAYMLESDLGRDCNGEAGLVVREFCRRYAYGAPRQELVEFLNAPDAPAGLRTVIERLRKFLMEDE